MSERDPWPRYHDHDINRSKHLLDIADRLSEGDISRPLAEAALLVGGFTDELVERVLAEPDAAPSKPEPFNINGHVWFVLSEHGARMLNERRAEYRSNGHDVKDLKAGETHQEQLWYVMQVFGPTRRMGADPCFAGNKIWFEDPEGSTSS